jgi:hypothetical protein
LRVEGPGARLGGRPVSLPPWLLRWANCVARVPLLGCLPVAQAPAEGEGKGTAGGGTLHGFPPVVEA